MAAPDAGRLTVSEYFALAEAGVIGPDERVELLDGIVVSMAPQSPLHASTVYRVSRVLERALGPRAFVRPQFTLPLAVHSAPEPDVAVVPGRPED
ncbi:MAG: Uma2 family endonuclease, partial [Candidatus Binatia bacterium]